MWWSALPVFILGPDVDENKENVSKLRGNEQIICLEKKGLHSFRTKIKTAWFCRRRERDHAKQQNLEKVACINQYNYVETWRAMALESAPCATSLERQPEGFWEQEPCTENVSKMHGWNRDIGTQACESLCIIRSTYLLLQTARLYHSVHQFIKSILQLIKLLDPAAGSEISGQKCCTEQWPGVVPAALQRFSPVPLYSCWGLSPPFGCGWRRCSCSQSYSFGSVIVLPEAVMYFL